MGEEYKNLGTNIGRKKISKSIVSKLKGDKIYINGQLDNSGVVLENPDPNFFLPEMYVQIKRLFNNYLSN